MNLPDKNLSTEFTHAIEVNTSGEAPKRIIEAQKYDLSYRAVAERVGGIKSDDFLTLSQRFVALSTEVYGQSSVELSLNRGVPVGLDAIAAGFGEYEGPQGTSIDMSVLDPTSFKDLFRSADSLVLSARPRDKSEAFASSFGQIEWTRKRASKLFFYAQDGGNYDLPANERPLQNALARKMFFVPESAPKGMLRVKLGIEAYINASEGNINPSNALAALALSRLKSR